MRALLKRIPTSAWAVLAMILPMLLLVVMRWYQVPIHDGKPIGTADPDPWLRLTLVREWLLGGSWYSHVMTHSNAPWGGISSPWTRPLDMVIALLTQLQPDAVELNLRLMRAALLLPSLWMALLLMGLFRAVTHMHPHAMNPWLVCALIASGTTMWNYFSPANADHHAMLAAVFVWVVAGFLNPAPRMAQLVAMGALLALQLWISPEAMVLIGGIYGWYGLRWLMGDAKTARAWPVLCTSVAAVSALALMVERHPEAWFAPVYDSISVVYVLPLMLVAAAVWVLHALRAVAAPARVVLAGISAAMVAYLSWRAFPLLLHGPMAEVDAYIFTDFLPRIVETQPLFDAPVWHVVSMLVQPLMAACVLWMAWRRRPMLFTAMHLLQLSYLLLLTGGLYLTQQRFYYYFYPMVVLVLAPALAPLFTPDATTWPARWLARHTPSGQMLRRLALLAMVMLLPMGLMLASPARDTPDSRQIDGCITQTRALIYSGGLNGIGGGAPLTFYAPTDVGGEMLFFTPHRIIASNYHREGAGIRYVWEANRISDMAQLRQHLRQRGVEALLLCPSVMARSDSVLGQLRTGLITVDWLEPVSVKFVSSTTLKASKKPVIFIVK